MDIYLPIAAVTENVFVLFGLGLSVGVVSGLFGVGGGFLLTPFLIFIGIPQAVAVASTANQLVGASLSGVIGYWRRGSVDFQMAGVLSAGGLAGSILGVAVFSLLRRLGQIDLVISLSYVILLGTLGSLMLAESVASVVRARQPRPRPRMHQHPWIRALPWKIRFRRSKLYVSALLPLAIGGVIGVLSAVLGVGGGFLLVPAMIYILGMPASTVPGTSLAQNMVVAISVTILQSWTMHTVDGVLVLLLLLGGVVGVHYGARYGTRIRSDYLRVMLALVILAVGAKLLFDLTATPASLFSVTEREP